MMGKFIFKPLTTPDIGINRYYLGVSLIALIRVIGCASSAQAQTTTAAPVAQETSQAVQVQEIVVTAEKRESTVQKTPISMTAISGAQLQAQGVNDLQGVIRAVPGISMRTSGPGQTELELRGLASSGGSVPTVGYYLDETPLSPPANSLNGKVVIDPDLYDLNRVEVLRGPQGTLYGSGSMGGTIKLITNQPNLKEIAGSADITVSSTKGGGFNRGGDAMINIPLVTDKVALRIVASDKYTDGWIDRIVLGANFPLETDPGCGAYVGCTRGVVTGIAAQKVYKHSNATLQQGVRATLLIKPTDALTIDISGLYQHLHANGYSEYDAPPLASGVLYAPTAPAGLALPAPTGGPLAHYQPGDLAEPLTDHIALVSGVIRYDFGSVLLTSSTSYWSRQESQTQDSTEALQNILGLSSFIPIGLTETDQSSQFSQELRLNSQGNSRLQWVGGVFLSRLKSTLSDINAAPGYAQFSTGPAADNPDGVVYAAHNPYHLNQYAVFGETNYRIVETLKFSAGLRYYNYSTTQDTDQWGVFTLSGNTTPSFAHNTASAHGFNPRFNLSYVPDKDLTIYATAAKGFRPGGINLPAPPELCPNQPSTYGPDSVWTYETGEKAKLANGRLTINGDVFYTQWNNVQQLLSPACGYQYTTNAGSARSYGVELETAARLGDAVMATFSGTYTSAKITAPAPGTGLLPGQPILNIPDFTFSGALVYHHKFDNDLDLVARVSDSYTGASYDISYAIEKLPAYNLVDLRMIASRGPISGTVFLANVTNTRAALGINNTSVGWVTPSLTRVSSNQPRTLGLTLAYKF